MAEQATSVTFEELIPTPTQEKPAESPAPAVAAAPEPPAATTPAFTEADAEAYRQMVDAGITPQNYQEFLQAKTAFANLEHVLTTNPRAFLNEIEKSNPRLASLIKQEYSDAWWEEYQRMHPEEAAQLGNSAQTGNLSRTAPSVDPTVMQKLASLESMVTGFIAKANQEETQRAQQAITDGYNKSVDGYIAKLPESVTERDRDYIRLKAQELLWKDTAARGRATKGVYVDVPKYIAEATRLATAETKAATEADKQRREGVQNRAEKTVIPAPEATGGEAVQDSHGDPIWGNISAGELKNAYK